MNPSNCLPTQPTFRQACLVAADVFEAAGEIQFAWTLRVQGKFPKLSNEPVENYLVYNTVKKEIFLEDVEDFWSIADVYTAVINRFDEPQFMSYQLPIRSAVRPIREGRPCYVVLQHFIMKDGWKLKGALYQIVDICLLENGEENT